MERAGRKAAEDTKCIEPTMKTGFVIATTKHRNLTAMTRSNIADKNGDWKSVSRMPT